MPHHEIFLKLVEGKVVPNPRSIRCKPLDTLEFSSEDGEVKIIFKPGGAVDPGPPGFKQATVKEVPFLFGCQLKLPNGAVVGWGQLGQGEAGGCGKTEPPTISEVSLVAPLPAGQVKVVGFCFDGNSIGQVNMGDRATSLTDSRNLFITLLSTDVGSVDIRVWDKTFKHASNVLPLQVTKPKPG